MTGLSCIFWIVSVFFGFVILWVALGDAAEEAARALSPSGLSQQAVSSEAASPYRGGFACPICGQETPHHHTAKVVDAYQNKRSRK